MCIWKCLLENGGHFSRPQCVNGSIKILDCGVLMGVAVFIKSKDWNISKSVRFHLYDFPPAQICFATIAINIFTSPKKMYSFIPWCLMVSSHMDCGSDCIVHFASHLWFFNFPAELSNPDPYHAWLEGWKRTRASVSPGYWKGFCCTKDFLIPSNTISV